jgi:hypothetical protein
MKQIENEEQAHNFVNKHGEENIVIFKVHAVSGWTKTDQRRFDSWTLLKETEDSGEEELMHVDPSARDGKGKQKVKDRARKLAKENKPAIVLVQNRDFEVYRQEVYE